VLRQASAELLGAGYVTVDLDEAERARDPPEEAETLACAFARRVGLVAEVGVLGLGRDLVVGDGDAERAEGFLPELLREAIETVTHRHEPPESAMSAERARER
jgi:hypothetical protein